MVSSSAVATILPVKGVEPALLKRQLRAMKSGDADWENGRLFSLVYYAGREHADLLKSAAEEFFYANALGPEAFKSLRRMEAEVVAMSGALLGLPGALGNMTSGGTESLLLAVQSARDWASAERAITEPEIILPSTAHPAFLKAAHYFGVKAVIVPVRADFSADVEATARVITPNTVLIVGSAPCYPFGVVDPIGELAALAADRGIFCHADACLGGFQLPFVEKLGYDVPLFDFRVPGVTSVSADLHKFGFGARGASVILYRDGSQHRRQMFTEANWPGGLYGSPTMLGSRPGGPIAAAWAGLRHLGEEGFLRLTEASLASCRELKEGIRSIGGLRVLGDPSMSVFAFAGEDLDVYALAALMERYGWKLEAQQLPPSVHMTVTPAHAGREGEFLRDLATCVAEIKAGLFQAEGLAALYGALTQIPPEMRGDNLNGLIAQFMQELTDVKKIPG